MDAAPMPRAFRLMCLGQAFVHECGWGNRVPCPQLPVDSDAVLRRAKTLSMCRGKSVNPCGLVVCWVPRISDVISPLGAGRRQII